MSFKEGLLISKFKFIQQDNKFCWANDDLCVVFHSSIIEADKNDPFEGLDDIEFFDYRISVFEKTFKDGIAFWKKVQDIWGEDLLISDKVSSFVDKALHLDTADGKVQTFENGNILRSKTTQTTTVDGEFWIIERSDWEYSEEFKNKLGDDFANHPKTEYTVIFGEIKHMGYYFPVVVKFLDEGEVSELVKTANAFLDFALDNYKKQCE